MILNEEQKLLHKEFRTFLRVNKGEKKLDVLMNAIEVVLPSVVQEHFEQQDYSIYDCNSINDLMMLAYKIKSNDELNMRYYNVAKAMDYYVEFYADKFNLTIPQLNIPDYETDGEEFIEGEDTDVKSKRYERSIKARKKCISVRGCKCYVCGFDFAEKYGKLGEGFIEIHHIVPISKRGGSYKLNPETDLVPLCSNCHSMVHRHKGEVVDIDELKRIISQN